MKKSAKSSVITKVANKFEDPLRAIISCQLVNVLRWKPQNHGITDTTKNVF